MSARTILCVAMLAASCWISAPLICPAEECAPVVGLDHIPVAVADLEQACAVYRALGFTVKPGRRHDK